MMMEETNIIQFPRPSKREVPSPEEVKARVEQVNIDFVDNIMMAVLPNIYSQLAAAGFDQLNNDSDDDNLAVYNALFIESLCSLMLYARGEHHPFQRLGHLIFEVNDDGMNMRESFKELIEKENDDAECV